MPKQRKRVSAFQDLGAAVWLLTCLPGHVLRRRNLQLTGDPHYQPEALKPYLGYDQRVGWQIIVEWFWLAGLAHFEVMPKHHAKLLTPKLLQRLLCTITTTKVTGVERSVTKHDILALLSEMRKILPAPLHRYLHLGLTSYDTICTAYALALRWTFNKILWPQLKELDRLWRDHICKYAETLQIGRTHLQHALPITIGCWLGQLHHRFVATAQQAKTFAAAVPGKFSGAVGTRAAINALTAGSGHSLESVVLHSLGLPLPVYATQIVPPEAMARFYHELTLLSAVLANLGDDVRHLQSSDVGEVTSASSGSSAMSHKSANPVAAEQLDGMHVTVRCAYLKLLETLDSTLQRDLRYSNVMRSYGEIFTFVCQQVATAIRLLKSFKVNEERCVRNFHVNGPLVIAELLHLALQQAGHPNAHEFVNQVIVPLCRNRGHSNLLVTMSEYVGSPKLARVWKKIPDEVKDLIGSPNRYLGDAVAMAKAESNNALQN